MKRYGTSFVGFLVLLVSMVGCTVNTNEEVESSAPIVETSEQPAEQAEEVEVVEEVEEPGEPEDATTAMIEEADYIAKVKHITKGQKGTELKVLQNIKGDVSANAVPELELRDNRAYVVFLKEDTSGVTLVDSNDAVILLEGDQHELFEKIDKHLYR